MGVGDYVRSKDGGPRRPPSSPRKARQLLAEQAKVEVPSTRLVAPGPDVSSGGAQPNHGDQAAASGMTRSVSHDSAAKHDMFDTDVEGVDDSTIAGTSVIDVEEFKAVAAPPSTVIPQQRADTESQTPSQLQQLQQELERRVYESNWYEGLGDKLMLPARFDSDVAETDASQVTESQPAESEMADDGQTEKGDWSISQRHQTDEEPLSRRLGSFWAARKRNPTKFTPHANGGQQSGALVRSTSNNSKNADLRATGSGSRKITLPRSMTTPRNRFSPQKPTLLEQLDRQLETSPTRQANGSRPRSGLNITVGLPGAEDDDIDVISLAQHLKRRDSGHSANIFDATNLDLLDEDEDTIHGLSAGYLQSKSRDASRTKLSKKRHLEADYPLEVIQQKSFADLQDEPFDRTPTPPPAPAPATATVTIPSDSGEASDRISTLLRLPDRERRSYLSNLSIDEWEDCGDQLIDRFSTIMTKMKESRHARRRTAAVFEAEIKRRHDAVEDQNIDLSKKLDEMRQGGIGVLRGRAP